MENQRFPYDFIRISERVPSEPYSLSEVFFIDNNASSSAIAFYLEIEDFVKLKQESIDLILKTIKITTTGSHSKSNLAESILENVNNLLKEEVGKIGKTVNMTIAFLTDKQIDFAYFGKVNCMLVHGDKPTNLTKLNNRFYFDEISSGVLKEGDWFAIGGSALRKQLEEMPGHIFTASATKDLEDFLDVDNATPPLGIVFRYQPNYVREQSTILVNNQPNYAPPLKANYDFTVFKKFFVSIKARFNQNNSIVLKIKGNEKASKNLKSAFGYLTSLAKSGKITPKPAHKPKLKFSIFNYKVIAAIILILLIAGGFLFLRAKLHRNAIVSTTPTQSVIDKVNLQTDASLVGFLNGLSADDIKSLSQDDWAAIKTKLSTTSIQLISPTLVNSMQTNIKYLDNGSVLAISNENGKGYELKNNLPQIIDATSGLTPPCDISALGDARVISSCNGPVLNLIDTSLKAKPLTIPAILGGATDLSVEKYTTNIYLYSDALKYIYKVSDFVDNLDGAKKYSNLATAEALVDWTVNNQIFSINASGGVNQIIANKITPIYTITPQTSIIRIETKPDWKYIYISDGHLIYQIDTKGKLSATYFVATENTINDIALNNVTSTLFIGAGKNLYSTLVQ